MKFKIGSENLNLTPTNQTTQMKPTTYDMLQIEGSCLKLTVNQPETPEEFDALAGKTGACVDNANANIVYRGTLADGRYYICEAIDKSLAEEFPGHPELRRKTKLAGKKGDLEVFDEAEAAYVRRVLPLVAHLRGVDEVKVDSFQPTLDRLQAEYEKDSEGNPTDKLLIRFDPSERERAERGPKKLPAKFLKAGETIVAQGQGEKFLAHFKVAAPVYPSDATAEQKSALLAAAIGAKIKSMEDAKLQEKNLADEYAVPA